MVQNTPLGRLGMPKDIADLITYLASENSGWITGSLIDAAGGWRWFGRAFARKSRTLAMRPDYLVEKQFISCDASTLACGAKTARSFQNVVFDKTVLPHAAYPL
jgi:hypothetical protein